MQGQESEAPWDCWWRALPIPPFLLNFLWTEYLVHPSAGNVNYKIETPIWTPTWIPILMHILSRFALPSLDLAHERREYPYWYPYWYPTSMAPRLPSHGSPMGPAGWLAWFVDWLAGWSWCCWSMIGGLVAVYGHSPRYPYGYSHKCPLGYFHWRESILQDLY